MCSKICDRHLDLVIEIQKVKRWLYVLTGAIGVDIGLDKFIEVINKMGF